MQRANSMDFMTWYFVKNTKFSIHHLIQIIYRGLFKSSGLIY